jgi:hypothetical protein
VLHLRVCHPGGCRLAFVSRGQPQEVTGVPSDANAVRWWHIVDTDNQQAVNERIGVLEVDRCALYGRASGSIWRASGGPRQSGLDRGSKSPHALTAHFFPPQGGSASRMYLNIQAAGRCACSPRSGHRNRVSFAFAFARSSESINTQYTRDTPGGAGVGAGNHQRERSGTSGYRGGGLCGLDGGDLAADSGHTKRAHSGPETTYSGSRYGLAALKAKGSRQPVDRPICSTWRHTEFPERSRSARPHGGIPSPGVEQRRGQCGWFLAKDLRH